MNGSTVIARTADAVFVRLPADQQRECGRCSCAYCTAHPDEPPMWDTLAVATAKPTTGNDYAWTVHMPDPGVMRDAIERGVLQGPHAAVVHGGRKR